MSAGLLVLSDSPDATFESDCSVDAAAWRSKSYVFFGSETDTETDDAWSLASESDQQKG